MTEELVIFGSGGHAKVMIEAARARSPQRFVILLDDQPEAQGKHVLGVPVTGTREWLLSNLPGGPVALGIGNNRARAELLAWLDDHGVTVEGVTHPTAIIGQTVEIGRGAFIAAGAILIAQARIGPAAIVNTGATVDHDCEVAEAAHIAPGVHLCGNVRVGARSLIGVGSAVRPGVVIGSDVVVGAGSAVVCDLPDGGTYAGWPAKSVSRRA